MGQGKVSLSVGPLVSRAMFCNWMVCLANFLQAKTDSIAGKAICVALPISSFASLGLEHSIVNMSILTLCLFVWIRQKYSAGCSRECDGSNPDYDIAGVLMSVAQMEEYERGTDGIVNDVNGHPGMSKRERTEEFEQILTCLQGYKT
jgi:hypothetical protein